MVGKFFLGARLMVRQRPPFPLLSAHPACAFTLVAFILAMSLARAQEAKSPGSTVAALQKEATALQPLVHTGWVKDFLGGTVGLPSIPTRKLFHDEASRHYYTEEEAARLSGAERYGLDSMEVDEEYYYNTRYGTPLAYARPLDLMGGEGFTPSGRRILDFGYGGIGQLRLLAGLGAEVIGVEVDPLTRALYSWPGDQGPISGAKGAKGSLRLVFGRFPAEAAVKKEVGDGYDLFISKNVLKRGYIHPEKPVPERQRINLGVDDAIFVHALASILKPGGKILIYNLSPAQNPPDKPYIPWADGRCPFPVALWKSAGLRVIELDRDDSIAARKMAHALGWDTGDQPIDLEKDLFAQYTLVEKPKQK